MNDSRHIFEDSPQVQYPQPEVDTLEEQETAELLTPGSMKFWKALALYRQNQLPQTPLPYDEDSDRDEYVTLPTLIVVAIAKQHGESPPVMQSEISGMANGAVLAGVGNLVSIGLKFISAFLIQRGFGAGIYGIYSIGIDLIALVAATFGIGLDSTMIRYVSIYKSKQQTGLLRGVTVFCTIIAVILGILGGVFVLFAAPYLAQLRHEPQITPLLQIMAPMVPLLCVQVVWFGGLQGFKAIHWRVLSERLLPPIVLIIAAGSMLLFYRSLIGIVLAVLLSTLVGTLSSVFFLFRSVSRLEHSEPRSYLPREWVSFALPNFLTAVTEIMLGSVDTLLLAFFAVADVGIGQYSAAIKIGAFVSLPLLSLNTMFAPTIAELHSQGEKQKLETMFKIVTKWTITCSLPILLVIILFAKPILALSGDSFVAAWPLLIALSLGAMLDAGTSCVGYMLMMTGHQKLSFVNSLTAFAINLGAGIILTPRYGAMGVAISTGLALGVVNVMRLLQVRLLLKVQPYRWDTLKPLGAGCISALVVSSLLPFFHNLPLFAQLVCIPLFLTIYVVLLVLFKASLEDAIIIDALRKVVIKYKH